MFGSPDEKNTPPAAAENPEKKSLFGWLRKKPQDEPAVAQVASETPTPPLPPISEIKRLPVAPIFLIRIAAISWLSGSDLTGLTR